MGDYLRGLVWDIEFQREDIGIYDYMSQVFRIVMPMS